ncbi:MAG: hypothetical protein IPP43_01030 [Chitinophagaceae bacterium]|nr:hypothetical protein [Chitinophagaceae bacterium]
MTNEQIEKFVLQKYLDKSAVTINFKARQSIKGLFIKTADYSLFQIILSPAADNEPTQLPATPHFCSMRFPAQIVFLSGINLFPTYENENLLHRNPHYFFGGLSK